MKPEPSEKNPSSSGLQWMLIICLLFGVLLLHTWVRTEATQITLEISLAQSRLSDLLSYQKELTVERDRLKSDDRIVHIARSQLGLTDDVFNQTIYLKREPH
ncbi:MAG TPA: cell division protein FtsL [Desulfotignum sp.]|jgi:cell division protein FtsL|nr:cell division protein FtsL [Desulfotignum sp.]